MQKINPSNTVNLPEILAGLIVLLGLGGIILLFQSPWFLLGILCALVGAVAVVRWHEHVPLALFVLLPFSVELQATGTTRLTLPTEILIPLLFLMFGIKAFLTKRIVFRMSWMHLLVIALYALMLFSLIYSKHPVSTIKAIVRDTGYIFAGFYLIPMAINSENRLRQFVYSVLIAHTLLIIYGFYTHAVGGIHIYGDIASPFFIEHCIYAAFITFTFSFLLAYLFDYESQGYFPGLSVITLFFGLAILLTFVRASWLSIIALLFFYLLQFQNRKAVVNLILFILILSFIGGGVLVTTKLGSLLLQRVDTIADFKYVANYDRIDRWLSAFYMWEDHPILGVGWGAYPDEYDDYIVYEKAFSAGERMGAHNLYLEIMAETGIIGIVLFLLVIYMFFRQAFILQHQVKSDFQRLFLIGLQGAMITYLFHAFFNNLGPSDKISISFWFMLGMIPTMRFLAFKDKEEGKTAT